MSFFFFFSPQPGSKNFFFRTKLEQFFVFYFQMSACEFYVSLTAMSYGDGDLGLPHKVMPHEVKYERLGEPGIEILTPWVQVEQLYNYTTEAPLSSRFKF